MPAVGLDAGSAGATRAAGTSRSPGSARTARPTGTARAGSGGGRAATAQLAHELAHALGRNLVLAEVAVGDVIQSPVDTA